MNTSASPLRILSLWIAILGLALTLLGDTGITTVDPWQTLQSMLQGAISPRINACVGLCDTAIDPPMNAFINPMIEPVLKALLNTISFALQGVTIGALFGAGLAMLFHYRIVRIFSAFIRAIHELFWALLFIQIFGLSPLTGVLAIGIPYAGTFARVYYELIDETDPSPLQGIPHNASTLSRWVYGRLTQAWPHIMQYNRYRTECALRSSAVLGFIGLPTLGFYLETAFRQGDYSVAAGLLYLFFFLVATLRWWLKAPLLPVYLLASLFWLPPIAQVELSTLIRFLTTDVVPAPLRASYINPEYLFQWIDHLVYQSAIPGIGVTLGIGLVALPLTGLMAITLFPLTSKQFFGSPLLQFGEFLLIAARSTPEYVLAFIGLLLLGPSWLPAIFALSLHNGAIVAHLIGHISNTLTLRPDASTGFNRYWYEVLPRIYPQFLALVFYRWEIILRETAILGILGLHTLGFYIDSAFETFRFDQALTLILITAILNVGADQLSLIIRNRFKLNPTPEEL